MEPLASHKPYKYSTSESCLQPANWCKQTNKTRIPVKSSQFARAHFSPKQKQPCTVETLFKNFIYLYVCRWRSKDSLQLVLFHLYVGPRDWTQAAGLGSKPLHPPSHLTAHQHFSIECMFQAWLEACHLLCWPTLCQLDTGKSHVRGGNPSWEVPP